MARVGPLAGVDIDALFNALRPRIIGLIHGGTSGSTGIGPPGPSGEPGAKGVAWKGEWAVAIAYEEGDIVWHDTAGGSHLTFFCLTAGTGHEPPVGGDDNWWEIDPGYLIVDGERPMTGALNMDHHSIDHIDDADVEGTATVGEDVVFTEGVGGAVISNPRILHMAGDHADDEAKVDGLERMVFNDEPEASSIEALSRAQMNLGVTPGTHYTATEGYFSWSTVEDALVLHVKSGAP